MSNNQAEKPQIEQTAVMILAQHGVQCEVSELVDLIYDDNAVLKLRYCLEAIQYALSLSKPEKEEEWIPVSEYNKLKNTFEELLHNHMLLRDDIEGYNVSHLEKYYRDKAELKPNR